MHLKTESTLCSLPKASRAALEPLIWFSQPPSPISHTARLPLGKTCSLCAFLLRYRLCDPSHVAKLSPGILLHASALVNHLLISAYVCCTPQKEMVYIIVRQWLLWEQRGTFLALETIKGCSLSQCDTNIIIYSRSHSTRRLYICLDAILL